MQLKKNVILLISVLEKYKEINLNLEKLSLKLPAKLYAKCRTDRSKTYFILIQALHKERASEPSKAGQGCTKVV